VLPDFTDANLFSSDRFAGLDRVESGPRMSYGMRGQAHVEDKFLDGVLGQQYRVNNDPNFPITSDLNSHLSDYVGKVGLTYHPYSLGYRFRLDKDNWFANRTEVDAGYNLYPLNVTASYLSLKKDPVLSSREVLTGTGSLNLTENWSLLLSSSRDMRLDQTVTASGGLSYKNECVNLTTMVGKDYTSLLDIKPSLTFWFRVSLKNLD
jgi:LPS-assembly protein